MAATTLSAIRAGLKANITAAVTEATMSGYLLSAPTAPGFEVEPGEIAVEYDRAMGRGVDEWTILVRGYVGLASDLGAQKKLDAWMDSSGGQSVKAAIESDRTLGGAVADAHVTQVTGYRTYGVVSQPNAQYLGAEWTVLCRATGE